MAGDLLKKCLAQNMVIPLYIIYVYDLEPSLSLGTE